MRKTILGAALAAIASGGPHVARADASPYAPSTAVTNFAWDPSSFRSGALGADIWAMTTGADGVVYGAYGDGSVGCPAKVSYGVAKFTGGANANPVGVGCGPEGSGEGKIGSLLDVAGTLYGIVNLQNHGWPDSDFEIWRSPNHGQTWERPGWRFPGASGAMRPLTFVNFGAGEAAPDGYVYLTALTVSAVADQHAVYLMRAPRASLFAQDAYTYFAGTDGAGAPTWSRDHAAAVPIFEDPNGLDGPEIVWAAPLGRFLLTASHTAADKIGVFESPTMWGGWATVDYESRWLGMTGGQFLGLQFPTEWMAADGRTLWATFSCYSALQCAAFSDRFNLIRVTLTPAGGPSPGSRAKTGRKSAPPGGTGRSPAPNTSPVPGATGSAPSGTGTGPSSRPSAIADRTTGAALANPAGLAATPPAASASTAPSTATTGSSVAAQRAAASAAAAGTGATAVGTVYVAAGSSGSTSGSGTGTPPEAPAPAAPGTAVGTPAPPAPEASGPLATDDAVPDAEDACRPGRARLADGTCGPASRPPAAPEAAATAKAAAGPDHAAEGCRDGDGAAACGATPAAAPAPATDEDAPAAGTSG